jgi:hypothetical protein
MAQKTLIHQTIKVKKVIKKAQSKFGKASVIVPFNGKDEFLGLNDSVDENAFTEGNSYKVGIAVSKTGKRYIEEIVDDLGADTDFVAPKAETKIIDTQEKPLDREVRITLMNVGNVAATLVAGDVDRFEEAFEKVKSVYKREGVL